MSAWFCGGFCGMDTESICFSILWYGITLTFRVCHVDGCLEQWEDGEMGKILDVVKRIFFTPDFSSVPMKNTVKQLVIEDWFLVSNITSTCCSVRQMMFLHTQKPKSLSMNDGCNVHSNLCYKSCQPIAQCTLSPGKYSDHKDVEVRQPGNFTSFVMR